MAKNISAHKILVPLLLKARLTSIAMMIDSYRMHGKLHGGNICEIHEFLSLQSFYPGTFFAR